MSNFDSNEPQHADNWETIIDFDNRNNLEGNLAIHLVDEDDDNESDYSLDYEFPGPRYANYRDNIEDDSPSDLSDTEVDLSTPIFDMWDDDPYNDFTWESNDMQLTKFIKQKQKQLKTVQKKDFSFWKKEKGWPKQLPFSCSTTNHDQSSNAICLVQSNCGLSEQLFAVYRDRIIECGKPPQQNDKNLVSPRKNYSTRDTTWIESSESTQQSSGSQNLAAEKFIDTHQSVSLSKIQSVLKDHLNEKEQEMTKNYIDKFKPFTKYIKRSDYPGMLSEDAYLALGFDPQCLAQKYGYMGIGGVEGEFELYCCMDPDNPVKIWGTKFKGKDNVMLMTNAIQLVRWKNNSTGAYQHMLIGCMNEAGLLFYHLPPHNQCKDIKTQRQNQQQQNPVKLHSHLRSFNGVPINDAKLSPDGTKLVCVGDDNIIFLIDVYHCITTGEISFGTPIEVVIPELVFQQKNMYSSQYVAWSPSSRYFSHTSDSHNLVLVWRVSTKEIIYSIDAAGYTYAISFHPQLDNILVFTNRYGYFHTVDFSKATTANSSEFINILTFDHSSREHQCLDTCIEHSKQAVFHTKHLHLRHEITMVSFRGELNTKLRILAKINGIEWSKDGNYLYIATKKRVLAFQFFCKEAKVPALMDITGIHVRKLLEIQEAFNSRKRKKLNKNDITSFSSTLQNWSIIIPDHIQYRILGDTQQLACHW
jgi:hypothetical protein